MIVDAAIDGPCARITKAPVRPRVHQNLVGSEEARRTFGWAAARNGLTGLPHGDGRNVAYEAVDRRADRSHARHVALRWLSKAGEAPDISYADRREELDLDSVDLVIIALHERLGVDIPEADYPTLATMTTAVACLSEGRGTSGLASR